jgi:hypothetical protein
LGYKDEEGAGGGRC